MSDLRVAAGEVAYPYDFESLRPEAQHQLVRTQAYSTPQHMVDLDKNEVPVQIFTGTSSRNRVYAGSCR